METVFAFTKVDPNRNVFNMITEVNLSSDTSFKSVLVMKKDNYTNMESRYVR